MKLPVEKNQTYTMSITDIGTNGEGIGRIDGYTVFVEGARKRSSKSSSSKQKNISVTGNCWKFWSLPPIG